MLTAGAIAPAVEHIAFPVTGICPRSENLKFYVNCVPQAIGLDQTTGLENGTVFFPALPVPTPICPYPVKISQMRTCSKTDHYFPLVAKGDFRFEKNRFSLKNIHKAIAWKE